jgi:hypothetical protein
MPTVKALAFWSALDAILMHIKAELGDHAALVSHVSLYGY